MPCCAVPPCGQHAVDGLYIILGLFLVTFTLVLPILYLLSLCNLYPRLNRQYLPGLRSLPDKFLLLTVCDRNHPLLDGSGCCANPTRVPFLISFPTPFSYPLFWIRIELGRIKFVCSPVYSIASCSMCLGS